MKILCVVALLGMTGCDQFESTVPKRVAQSNYRAMAGVGVLYGMASSIYTVGKRDEQQGEIDLGCKQLAKADDIVKDLPDWPKEYVESFNGMADFRAACEKKVTEN